MLTNIGTVTVQMSDQDAVLAFYSGKLGLEMRSDRPMGPR